MSAGKHPNKLIFHILLDNHIKNFIYFSLNVSNMFLHCKLINQDWDTAMNW